ncbi:putative efflux protein, MATE family [Porphyromonadaceae bacterium NLAE-zl-C104]|uniref:MATE family efflux transporter n=1 Tax=Proteiniphilum TaxID=294702 RepID=UPI0008999BCB|nr:MULTISPECIES: MATE family efflux transporter [Proteiniphilum]MDY9917405.1 MATE family efflux transporter [Proteiniphilum sp.]SEA29941.1 putative efflux protein, MATE family [Porphyromonadaceae bacterium KH3R12]SFS79406.1 putative efflux protein, MATE family [Porphyromonadaceae bacterium NLAE-zl-C104]
MESQSLQTSAVRDLTRGGIFRQLLTLALPLMAISFIQMAYNLVDIIWIGRLGSQSVAAVGTVGMLMWMMNSVALISKVAAEISIGQSIGARRLDQASLYASHTTTIAILLGLLFGMFFLLFPHPYISFYKLEQEIAVEATGYLQIISLGIPIMFLILNFSGIYIGSGRSDIPFYFNATGLVLNIVLDPLLIFGAGPIPAMGVKGAALATILSQSVVLLLFVRHLKKKNGLLGKFPFLIRPRRRYTLNILKLGLPVAAMNTYFAFINMNLARIASLYGGHLGITSQTTGGQIEGITWNTSTGFSTALGSFVAQNFAALKMSRANRAFRYTLMMMGALGIAVTLAFVLYGEGIFSVFVPEKEAYEAGGEYLLIIGISQVFMMLEITTQGMFNGLGRTTPPAIISIVFNTLRIPIAMVLGTRMGVTGVWWALSITSIFKGIILFIWYLILQKRLSSEPVSEK